MSSCVFLEGYNADYFFAERSDFLESRLFAWKQRQKQDSM